MLESKIIYRLAYLLPGVSKTKTGGLFGIKFVNKNIKVYFAVMDNLYLRAVEKENTFGG